MSIIDIPQRGLLYSNIDIINKTDVKIASFDLDYTLIEPKSGKTFPIDYDDWRPLYNNIKTILHEYVNNNYIIVIFTNQKKIKCPISFSAKIRNIMSLYEIDVNKYTYYISYSDNGYRKPMTGMYDMLIKANNIISIDIENSFYCGDAGGRIFLSKNKIKDHSIVDLHYAKNIGLKFKLPEEVFSQKMEPYYVNDPYLNKSLSIWFYQKKSIPWKLINDFSAQSKKKMIITVGSPASGKSYLTKYIEQKYIASDYKYFNSDTQGTSMFKLFSSAIRKGNNVIIDNTNPSNATRNKYYEIATDYDVLILYFDYPKELSFHMNNYRVQKNTYDCHINDKNIESKDRLPDMIYHIYNKKLEIPTLNDSLYGNNINVIRIIPEMIIHNIKDKAFYYSYDI